MFFLILSIFSSSMIGIVMRLSQDRIRARISMLAANYLTCTISALFFTGLQEFAHPGEGFGLSLGLGTTNGFVYVISLVLAQYNVRKNGVVLQSVFSKIGALLVPVVVSVALFAERPGWLQIVGGVLSLAAIFGMNVGSKSNASYSMLPLMGMFLIDGLVGVMSKLYGEIGASRYASHFLLFTFGTALILCIIILLARKERPGLIELGFGILIGIPNYFSSRFLLRALATVPAVVAYPIRSVGSILVVTMAGLFLFREKLHRAQWISVAVILAAVVLLSV